LSTPAHAATCTTLAPPPPSPPPPRCPLSIATTLTATTLTATHPLHRGRRAPSPSLPPPSLRRTRACRVV
jgi:hypothetical protein